MPSSTPNTSGRSSSGSAMAEGSKRKAPDSTGDEQGTKKAKGATAAASPGVTAAGTSTDEDAEWALFQQEVLAEADATAAAPQEAPESDARIAGRPAHTALRPPPPTAYADATIEAQPQLRKSHATGANGEAMADGEGEDGADGDEETEEQRRERLRQEEKEEILARLEEEQRLQDEAEERVSSLKSRLERIKAARAAKAAKSGTAPAKGAKKA